MLPAMPWERVPRTLYPEPTVDLPWGSLLLGMLERGLYVTALLIGGGALAFIGAWLALKVAGRWDYWKSAKTGKLYILHLVGMGLSLAYAAVGWQVILWSTVSVLRWADSARPWSDVLLSMSPALLAAMLVAATLLVYCWLGGGSKMAKLTVLFIDGTEREFEATEKMVEELEKVQSQRGDLCFLEDRRNRLTLCISQVRAWSWDGKGG